MTTRSFSILSNLILTVLALVWAYLKYTEHNLDAVYTALAGAAALWKHSGRRREAPPTQVAEVPSPAGSKGT